MSSDFCFTGKVQDRNGDLKSATLSIYSTTAVSPSGFGMPSICIVEFKMQVDIYC